MLLKRKFMVARDDNLAGMRQFRQPPIKFTDGFETMVRATKISSVNEYVAIRYGHVAM
jgi:hypothetical protein